MTLYSVLFLPPRTIPKVKRGSFRSPLKLWHASTASITHDDDDDDVERKFDGGVVGRDKIQARILMNRLTMRPFFFSFFSFHFLFHFSFHFISFLSLFLSFLSRPQGAAVNLVLFLHSTVRSKVISVVDAPSSSFPRRIPCFIIIIHREAIFILSTMSSSKSWTLRSSGCRPSRSLPDERQASGTANASPCRSTCWIVSP